MPCLCAAYSKIKSRGFNVELIRLWPKEGWSYDDHMFVTCMSVVVFFFFLVFV